MMAAGVRGDTPMALVDRASMPSSQVVAGTLESLPALVDDRRKDLAGPAMVLLGPAVGLRERMEGTRPQPNPAASSADAMLAMTLAAVPSLDDAGLETLKASIDSRLAASRKRKAEALDT
eukprot:TRINITY_DN32741_c0_g1_i1.p1 TRINITY_DN32741_c0_g1~~TRINITY_DN32741_c0_g1_i1.p1  ORF type:complete len:120 (-),score=23.69 TRINITY_DN32741_c0_g1_i1:54-413(-)